MGVNYIKYNELGLLESAELSPISKGNNYVDTFYFYFENSDFTNAYLTFTATLPNGNTLPSATTTPAQYWDGNTSRNVYMMKLSNAYTSIAGTMTFTLSLKKNGTNELLCSAQLTLTINDTDVSVPTTITETEKGQIQQAIADAVRDLDNRKVEVDLNIYGEATTIEERIGKIAISSGGKTYKYPASKVVNKVDSVNGYTGDISLKSSDIPHNENTVENVLDNLEQRKANSSEVCFYRDFELIPEEAGELRPKGFLSCSVKSLDTITLDTETFQFGDLLSFDVIVFDENNNYLCKLSFLKLLSSYEFEENRYVIHLDEKIYDDTIKFVLISENELKISAYNSYSENMILNVQVINARVYRW